MNEMDFNELYNEDDGMEFKEDIPEDSVELDLETRLARLMKL